MINRRTQTPEEARKQHKDNEAFKRSQISQVISMAEDMAITLEDKGYNHILNIHKAELTIKEKEYDQIIKESVETILKQGKTRYLLKRGVLEAEIKQLKRTIALPEKYGKEAKRLLEENPNSRNGNLAKK
jgi:hypothetical protein